MDDSKLARRLARAFLIVSIGTVPAAALAQPAAAPMPTTPAVPGPTSPSAAIGLAELSQYALGQNPRLAQGTLAIDAARGRALQAGLYPNPTVSINLDELGDRTGPQGVNTLPLISQEIVTGGKLKLSQAAAGREVDQATLTLASQRFSLLGNVRAAYFDVVTLQRRIEILEELVKTASASVAQTEKLRKAGQVATLDLVQLEVEQERLRADLEANQRELPAAYQRLASVVGAKDLPPFCVAGSLELPLPPYDLGGVRRCVLSLHPERQFAIVGVDRARLQLQREQAEPIPNVTVSGGYVRQNQNRSNDWTVGVSVPLPVWNRNQGRIASASAELGSAQQEVGRVENDLSERVASAFRDFAAARQRAERYRTGIVPKAKEAYQLSLRAYQGGTFEYLRVLEAQRTISQANLEYVRALGDAWKAASILSALTLEEQWPPALPAVESKAVEEKPSTLPAPRKDEKPELK